MTIWRVDDGRRMKEWGLVRFIAARFIAGRFTVGRFIARSIHRRVNSSQGWFLAESIPRRVDSLQGWIIAELCQLKTWLKREIIWLDIQNWFRFVVKTFSSPLGATEKLVILKSTRLKCIIFGLNTKTGFF
jgi:hypothetical protein